MESMNEERMHLMDEWIGSAPEIPESAVSEEIQTDILVCGFGHAGQVATLVASQQGEDVVVLEKSNHAGYFKTYLAAVDSKVQKAAGKAGEIDKEEIIDELVHYGTRYTDEMHVYKPEITRSKYQGANPVKEELVRLWANESGASIDFIAKELEPYGYKLTLETDNPHDMRHGMFKVFPVHNKIVPPASDGVTSRVHGSLFCVEKGMTKACEKYGAKILWETPMVKLIQENERVIGAIAQRKDGNYVKVLASKGVLLATGGYADDDDAYVAFNPEAASVTTFSYVGPGNKGDGLKAASWLGADRDKYPSAMLFDRGATKPGGKAGLPFVRGGGPDAFHFASNPFLKVDMDGKRFCNETVPYDFILMPLQDKKNGVEVVIWDRQYWKNIKAFHNIGCSRHVPSNARPRTWEGISHPVTIGFILLQRMTGNLKKAWSIEKLARKLQLPVEQTKATVERYNKMAEQGRDDDFGKPAKHLFPVSHPPYYGITNAGWILCTMDGLEINADMQVLDKDGQVIEGLYAAGNDAGGFFANNYYPELIVGIASGKSMTFARHAILHMTGKTA